MSEQEILMVCQVPECGSIGDEWMIGEHMYFYCADHATELGWCTTCERYVGRENLYTYGYCADCLETEPFEVAELAASIDEMIDDLTPCPNCGSTDVTVQHDGGWCHSCEQMWQGG